MWMGPQHDCTCRIVRCNTLKTVALALGVAVLLLAPAGTVLGQGYTTVLNTGPSSNRVDIVFLGDGYTAPQMSDYATEVNGMLAYLMAEQPFTRYANFFNAHRVDLVSSETGADDPTAGIYRDTALDASYRFDGQTQRLLYISESKASTAIANALAGSGIAADIRSVSVNASQYGGGGEFGTYAVYSAGNANGREVQIHEIGHSFGWLNDEYVDTAYYPGSYPGTEDQFANSTTTTDPVGHKWAAWLGETDPTGDTIGFYEGSGWATGIYRSTPDSAMRGLYEPFNAVSREELILRIYECVDPMDAWLENTSLLYGDDELWVDLVDPAVIGVQWFVDGVEVAGATDPAFRLADYGYGLGTYQVEALARDTLAGQWVRRDLGQLEQSVGWTVAIVPEPATLALSALGLAVLAARRRRDDAGIRQHAPAIAKQTNRGL